MSGETAYPYRAAVCTVTPFDEAGRLDEAAVEDLVERIASAGASLCIGTASPGEGFALSLEETERFFDLVVRTNAGRVPVCAMGVEPRNDGQLRPIVRLAEQAKLDTMQLYTVDPGHAMKLTDDELERFFAALLDEMTIPAVISTHVYNGLVPLGVLARLLDHYPNIAAIHCTSEVNYLAQLLETVDGRCEVLVGGPMQALSVHALGGQGFLCSEGNITPVLCGELQDALRTGDLAAAERSYRQDDRRVQPQHVGGWHRPVPQDGDADPRASRRAHPSAVRGAGRHRGRVARPEDAGAGPPGVAGPDRRRARHGALTTRSKRVTTSVWCVCGKMSTTTASAGS